jgi:hypothetical protein
LLAPEAYYQAVKEEDPSEEDDDGYESMEDNLTKVEDIRHAILVSEAEERDKWIGLEEAIQLSQ